MTTLFVAAILVGLVAAIFLLIVSIDKKQKRMALNQLLHAFHKAGSDQNLTFSSQEILSDSVIGLDGLKRKLFVLEREDGNVYNSLVIELNDVIHCSVKRSTALSIGVSRMERKKNSIFNK